MAQTVDSFMHNCFGTMSCFTGTEPVLICSLPWLYSDMHIGICALCNRRLTRGVRRRHGVHTATPSLQGYSRMNTEQCLQLWTGPVHRSYCSNHLLYSVALLQEICSWECTCNSSQTADQKPVECSFMNCVYALFVLLILLKFLYRKLQRNL